MCEKNTIGPGLFSSAFNKQDGTQTISLSSEQIVVISGSFLIL